MSEAMLAKQDDTDPEKFLVAEDGMTLDL